MTLPAASPSRSLVLLLAAFAAACGPTPTTSDADVVRIDASADTAIDGDVLVTDVSISDVVDADAHDAVDEDVSCTGGTRCGDRCVDTATDATNCGACGVTCPAGNVCLAGACAIACDAPRTRCGATCADTTSDDANCGACGAACTGGAHCTSGACACPSGQTACGDHCVDTTSDNANCGACGTVCTPPANGTATCTAGTCQTACDSGFGACATGCCPLLRALSVSAGGNSTCAVMSDHTLMCWGENTNGQLGVGDTTARSTPTPVPGLANIAAVSIGAMGACAITTTGALYCWGSLSMLPFASASDVLSPRAVSGAGTVTAVSVGSVHGCVLQSSGSVACFGSNSHGQIGSAAYVGVDSVHSVATVSGLGLASAVIAGASHSCAAQRDGQILCWGEARYGAVGFTSSTDVTTPTAVPRQSGRYVRLAASTLTTLAVTDTGRVDCWGYSFLGGCGVVVSTPPTATQLVTIAGFDGSAGVATTLGSTFAWGATGAIACTGSRYGGQCGDGTSTGYDTTPTTVSSLVAPVPAVDGGEYHTCAVDNAGVVYCWGSNSAGQLGTGTMTNASVPTRVTGF